MFVKQKIDWRNLTNVGFIEGLMGFYESQEEILACPHYCDVTIAGRSDSIIAGFGGGSVYLYSVLMVVHAENSCQGMGLVDAV